MSSSPPLPSFFLLLFLNQFDFFILTCVYCISREMSVFSPACISLFCSAISQRKMASKRFTISTQKNYNYEVQRQQHQQHFNREEVFIFHWLMFRIFGNKHVTFPWRKCKLLKENARYTLDYTLTMASSCF